MIYNAIQAYSLYAKLSNINIKDCLHGIYSKLGFPNIESSDDELSPYMKHVKCIIAIGQCRERVVDFGQNMGIPTYSYEFLKDGFVKGYEESCEGDIILLSPASASWDQYKECEIRGTEFKNYVAELKKKIS